MVKSVNRYISELLDAYQEITQKLVLKWQWILTLPFPPSIFTGAGKGAQEQTQLTKL